MNREDCLNEAKKYVSEIKNVEYGKPENSFKVISDLWGCYLEKEITPHDVAVLMALFKIGRIKTGTHKGNNYVDCAGYIACACELGE